MFGSVSDYNYPEDEFDVSEDEGPVPVGVHRAQVPRWRSWLPLLAVIIIVPVLAWGAVTLLDRQTSSDSADPAVSQPADGGAGGGSGDGAQPGGDASAPAGQPSAGATSSATSGQADLTLGVTVLNGTETSGLAGRTGDRLTNAGFSAVEVPQGIYGETEPSASTVFYSQPEHKATAEQIAEQLGIGNVVEDPDSAQSSPIVVILREDFQE